MSMPRPFTLNGATVKVTSTGTTASQTIAMKGSDALMVTTGNSSTTGPVAFIASGIGSATATTSSTPIIGPSAQVFSIPPDHDTVAVISASGTVDVYFTVGSGQ